MARVFVTPDDEPDQVLMCGRVSLAELDGHPSRSEAFLTRLASAITLAEGEELPPGEAVEVIARGRRRELV